ncbi:hypothetical protein NA78x_001650 [Anatilimnocola sp. NA78]|uniref:hypothetical protein n=1 Tax=Anatilimnocola sp. NA78 TaxID=3415683 RepID=UPI003CE5658A
MNDHLSTDQRKLELATMRKLSGTTTLDATTIAQRKTWLAVGAAAEDAGREGLDQAALLAKLQSELIPAPPATTSATQGTIDWSWGTVILAAVVLIAATVIGAISQQPEKFPIGPAPQIAQPQSPKPVPVQVAQETEAPAPANDITPAIAVTSAGSSWNDLDEAIQSTYTALQQLSNQPTGVDRSLTDFDSQLKQLSADLAGESL